MCLKIPTLMPSSLHCSWLGLYFTSCAESTVTETIVFSSSAWASNTATLGGGGAVYISLTTDASVRSSGIRASDCTAASGGVMSVASTARTSAKLLQFTAKNSRTTGAVGPAVDVGYRLWRQSCRLECVIRGAALCMN